jgi:hypothetical protein
MNLKQAQHALVSLGFPTNTDGVFSGRTMDAFLAFQSKHDLFATGTLDLMTEKKLSELTGMAVRTGAAEDAGLEMVKRASFLQGVLAGSLGAAAAGGIVWALRRSMSRSEESEDPCDCGECPECLGERSVGLIDVYDFEEVEEDEDDE